MSINQTPNQLNKTSYQFLCDKLKDVSYNCQSANIPGVNLGRINRENPFTAIKTPGEVLTFESLNINFVLDEDMKNWLEIFNWMKELGFPSSFDEAFENSNTNKLYIDGTIDATLNILNNKKLKNLKCVFKNIFPVSLSSIEFDDTTSEVDPIIITATFDYVSYDIIKV
jgi:hypothetical protein